MDSTLAVTVPADSFDLTTVETVRAVAGITEDQISDDLMEILIQQASGIVAEHCGRVFGLETLIETFWPGWQDAGRGQLVLSRRPVAAVTSVEENGAVIDSADYAIDYSAGTLLRLSSGQLSGWCSPKIVVAYEAGYLLLDGLPYGIERACIELIRNWWTSGSLSGRDTSLRRESIEIPGVRTIQQEFFASGSSSGSSSASALPDVVINLLNPHREVYV